jgi:hypothetical protein
VAPLRRAVRLFHLPLDRRSLRAALGLLWLLDAALQCQPLFFHAQAWRQGIAQSVMGEPGWVAHGVFLAVGIISAHPAVWNAGFVATQGALGLALLTDRLPRAAIWASVPYAIGVWWVGEGFGGLPTGFANLFAGSPGPAVLYALLGLLAWPQPVRSPRPARSRWPVVDHAPYNRLDAGAGRGAPPERPIRSGAAAALWAALWAGQAVLFVPWVFPSRQLLTANLEETALDAPSWLAHVEQVVSHAVAAEPTLTVVALAAVQVLVGLGVLLPRTRRSALVVGLLATAAFWVIGQAFGGILVAGGTDPGTAPLLALLAGVVWPAPSVLSRPAPLQISSRFATSP